MDSGGRRFEAAVRQPASQYPFQHSVPPSLFLSTHTNSHSSKDEPHPRATTASVTEDENVIKRGEYENYIIFPDMAHVRIALLQADPLPATRLTSAQWRCDRRGRC